MGVDTYHLTGCGPDPLELTEAVDCMYQPTPEEEREHWSGKGHVEFFVISNRKKTDTFEIEVIDYSGCLGGLDEMIGIEWAIKEGYLGDRTELWEGINYTYHGVTVDWTRGDGWTTDDDCDYYVESMTSELILPIFIYHTLKNLWWFTVGWRIRESVNRRRPSKTQ